MGAEQIRLFEGGSVPLICDGILVVNRCSFSMDPWVWGRSLSGGVYVGPSPRDCIYVPYLTPEMWILPLR